MKTKDDPFEDACKQPGVVTCRNCDKYSKGKMTLSDDEKTDCTMMADTCNFILGFCS